MYALERERETERERERKIGEMKNKRRKISTRKKAGVSCIVS
jgi:hypothetical protein